ncbi:MAG TPA: hypothetical protein VK666_24595 [Chryseolinea sp.]|nr:hypothetical protein [Chryseolinea sp.]
MELRPASAGKDDYDEQIAYYKGKSLSDLQTIVPRWAYGADADKSVIGESDQNRTDISSA